MVGGADRRRFEIAEGKISALYGHSAAKIEKRPAMPPAILYNGTCPQKAALIRKAGLLPMGRQYVHLAVDRKTAADVGGRRCRKPVILVVKALESFKAGITFYEGSDLIWLADFVPASFLDK